jgi:hypothetical protein
VDTNVFEQNYAHIERNIISNFDGNKNTGIFILSQDIVKLLALLWEENDETGKTLIPNLALGELALCADEWDGYSILEQTENVLKDKITGTNNCFIHEDFLEANIEDKYHSIILCPPFGMRTSYGRSEIAYIEKCLSLLDIGGRLIALVPQNIISALAFKGLREKILREYSLNAVIAVKGIGTATNVEASVIIIENKNQTKKIYMSLGGQNSDDIYEGYKHGTGGFFVDSSEVYDRFDVNYFDPKYKSCAK